MTASGHFDDRKSLSITFLAISYQYATLIFFLNSQNGCRRPFWMTENHFRMHFSPFQINTQLFCLKLFFILEVQFGAFWMTEYHFRSHFSPFQINTQLFFSKWPPAAILEVRFAPKTIRFFHNVLSMAKPNMKLIGEFITQLEMPQVFLNIFIQNGRQRPFCFSDLCQKS